jgi:hypothetical protein
MSSERWATDVASWSWIGGGIGGIRGGVMWSTDEESLPQRSSIYLQMWLCLSTPGLCMLQPASALTISSKNKP